MERKEILSEVVEEAKEEEKNAESKWECCNINELPFRIKGYKKKNGRKKSLELKTTPVSHNMTHFSKKTTDYGCL